MLVNSSLGLVIAALAGSPVSGQTPRPRLLLLGDSLTAGYGLPAAQAFPARLQRALERAGFSGEIVNAGVSGDTSAGGLARLDWAIGDRPPSHALVALGANDGLRGLPPEAMEANLDAILARLKARAVKPMLAGMLAPPNLGREYAERFNAVFARVATKHAVPLYPFFLDGVAADPNLNQPDGIHPNGAGVDVIVERMLAPIRRFLEN
ncbi:MAG: arylesterase [Alphaproteobacteria bacterium]|nr:arylesterase [Alphaproteobacteria bacterium]